VHTYYNKGDENASTNFQKSAKKFQKDYSPSYLAVWKNAGTVSCGGTLPLVSVFSVYFFRLSKC
jgi:hypothetical protein